MSLTMLLTVFTVLQLSAAPAAAGPAQSVDSGQMAPLPAEVLLQYDAIRLALVADQLSAVGAAARTLEGGASSDSALAAAAHAVAMATDLPAARTAFGQLSRLVVTRLAATTPPPKVVVYHCPMYSGFSWWIQPKSGIANPYMGQEMPGCGEEMSLKAAAKDAAKVPVGTSP